MLRRPHISLPLSLLAISPLILGGWTLTAVMASPSSAASLATSPSPSPSPTPTPTPAASGGNATNGQQVYSQSDCVSCHGSNLEGGVGPKLNPIMKLQGVQNPLDPGFLFSTIKNGRPASDGFASSMPAHSNLSDQAIRDIVAFIIQQNKTGSSGLSPVDLARSNVLWITVTIGLLVLVTWLLARYNMRWIARRAAAGREEENQNR